MGSDWPEDYFSYSPYLLTPDLSSKSRAHRRQNRRSTDSSSRYEISIDEVLPMSEHPRMRPPEPASPILDRRFPTFYSHGRRDDLDYPSVYPDEIEQDCFIVPKRMSGRFCLSEM
ncbi:uncharacterized protein CEXT_520591 [Caerostris extrusa]|uniref:Uncharacterized protein n=1 Tax=Caerostris extrusa TaxID=172846 RepID=A0AAV4T1W0_CAEEX|nr:uncharacterized protein CEXT_520591 [Caerostris extrusa]